MSDRPAQGVAVRSAVLDISPPIQAYLDGATRRCYGAAMLTADQTQDPDAQPTEPSAGAPTNASSPAHDPPRTSTAAQGMGRKPRGGRLLRATAVALDPQGAGLCQQEGWTIHVPGLLPTEQAQIQLTHVSPHRQEAWAHIQRRLNAAPQRTLPDCTAYGLCGGCILQHMDYRSQVEWKNLQFREYLADLGLSAQQIGSCVPACDDQAKASESATGGWLRYRSRVKLIPARDEGGSIYLGSYAPRSHTVIRMDGCQVNAPALTATARTLTGLLGSLGVSIYDEKTESGVLRYVLLRETHSGEQQVSLVIADTPPSASSPTLTTLANRLQAAHPAIVSIVVHHNRSRGNALLTQGDALPDADPAEGDISLLGPPYVWEQIGPISLRVSARSFLQVHRDMAARIYADVAAAIDAGRASARMDSTPSRPPHILDIYCGVGGLGLSVLSHIPGSTLVGVEYSGSAIADAQQSALRLGLQDRARFLCGSAEAVLASPAAADLMTTPGTVDVAILNPPRRGCTPEVLSAVTAACPRQVIYVSCSPESLARDIQTLCRAGYHVARTTPYDMHPGTPHIESVTVLQTTLAA